MTYVRRSQSLSVEEHPLPRRSSQPAQQTKIEPVVVSTSEVYFVADLAEPVATSVDVNVVESLEVKDSTSDPFENEEAALHANVENEIAEVVKTASTSTKSTKRKG